MKPTTLTCRSYSSTANNNIPATVYFMFVTSANKHKATNQRSSYFITWLLPRSEIECIRDHANPGGMKGS